MNKELFQQTAERFRNDPIYKETERIRKQMDEVTDLIELIELEEDLDVIKEFSVTLIQRVKDGDEFAFDELMDVRDMKNFLNHYSYHIAKYHKFKYNKEEIKHEIRFQIFYHVKKNYRIYNEPHEISLLIMSMRRWIRQKVSNSLKPYYFTKEDSSLNNELLEYASDDFSDLYVTDLLDKCLTEEEKKIYDLRVNNDLFFFEIGETMGYSKDTAKRRYYSALDKIKKEIEGDAE